MRLKINLLIFAFIIGLFIPTSIDGEVSFPLSLLAVIIPAFILLLTLRINLWFRSRIVCVLVVFGIMSSATLLSPFSYIAWGGAAPYILAAIVLLTDFRSYRNTIDYKLDLTLTLVILFTSLVILILGFGIINNEEILINIVRQNYTYIDEELYENMVVWHSKPVTVFGSHSTAAFAYFSLFILNLKISKNVNLSFWSRCVYFLLAVGFVILNLFLGSNTSNSMVVLMALFIVMPLVKMRLKRSEKLFVVTILFCVFCIAVYFGLFQFIIGDSDGNGFSARYGSNGRLDSTYSYLLNNYFIPVGISNSPALSFGDNFIAEYIIKTSIIGYLIILILLFTWLRYHVKIYAAIAFFLFFLIADLAYPLLVYSRVAAALPVFVLIWYRLDAGVFFRRIEYIKSYE